MFEHLGAYSDWVDHSITRREPDAPADSAAVRAKVREVLGADGDETAPGDVRVERRWVDDDLVGEEISWDVGYGPRTRGWVLRPTESTGPLPGVLALHCHSAFKYYGKEKIADGPEGAAPGVADARATFYSGVAYANELAQQGFVVLVHDVFMWGSRRFELRAMPSQVFRAAGLTDVHREQIDAYNTAALYHEHFSVEKYCRLLGTTIAAVVAREDRAAVAYLRSRPDVISDRLGCVGLSGGGLRAGLLQATCDHISATVVVGMMSTYAGLLDRNVADHTWMLFPAEWPSHGDWPDLVGCRPTSPLLVQYNREDELFTAAGTEAAHHRLQLLYRRAGNPHGYAGQFFDGGHKFDSEMQGAAFSWLSGRLGRSPSPDADCPSHRNHVGKGGQGCWGRERGRVR
ncbi:dienelactone hydrolase family protein [Streptomyces sp. NPDC000994]